MAITEFLLGHRKATVGLVTLDASVSETHDKQAEVTAHPVELGSDVTDHIRRTPERLKISGVVTNHPLVFLASTRAQSPVSTDVGHVQDRAERADREFRRAMDAGELVEVFTTLRAYRNMAIVGYSVTRDKGRGAVLDFTIELQEVVLVSTERVQAPTPTDPSNSKVKDLGVKAVEPADPSTAAKSNDSIAVSIKDGISNFIFGGP